MTITLLGDSLTAGNLGIPYTEYLKLPEESRVINHGMDGDTILGVCSRLDDALRTDKPDILVIQTGANDLLLPEMAARDGNWTPFIEEMTARGSLPTPNYNTFAEIYTDMIEAASSRGIDGIVCVTIPPIGENLGSERNHRRVEYNRQIRETAGAAGAGIADAAEKFENLLKELTPLSDWFFDNPMDFTTDTRKLHRAKGAMALSEKRGLYLTMDGAHLNERGAELMGTVISRAILACC